MGIQINGATDSITAIDGTIDVVSAIGNAGVVTATAFVGNITGNVTGNINHASNLELQVGGVTRGNFDSSGRLLIGTTTGGYGEGDDLTLATSGHTGITIRGGTSSDCNIYFADGTSGNAQHQGIIQYRHSLDALRFFTNAGERLRINSGGEVLIGTTTGTGNNLTVQDAGTSTTAGGNIVARFQSNGSGRDATIQLSDNVANSATISMLSSALIFKQSGTETLRITAAGNMGLGTNNPQRLLHLQSTGDALARITSADGNAAYLELGDVSDPDGGKIVYDTGSNLEFYTASSPRLRIDSNGRALFSRGGLTASRNVGTKTGEIQVANSGNSSAITIIGYSNDVTGPHLMLGKTRSTNATGNTIVQNNDRLGEIAFCGNDGSDLDSFGAAIKCHVDGTPGANDMPGRLQFYTTPDGGSSSVERLRITSAGVVQIGKDDQSSTTFTQDLDIRGRYVNAVGDFSRLMFRNSTNSGNSSSSIRARRSGNNYNTNLSFFTHYSTSSGGDGLERLRITPLGQFLQRQQSYSETYQTDNFGNAMYIKSGWLRFSSNFSNPTKDLVILADGGNANNSLYIKVTVMHLDYPGADRGVGAISIGYASAKRAGDNSGKWHAEKSNMAIESGSNFHGAFSNVGTLSWENSNTSDTNTLRYTSNRVANYDQYHVQVEVWQRGNCSYYLHSDYVA